MLMVLVPVVALRSGTPRPVMRPWRGLCKRKRCVGRSSDRRAGTRRRSKRQRSTTITATTPGDVMAVGHSGMIVMIGTGTGGGGGGVPQKMMRVARGNHEAGVSCSSHVLLERHA